MVNKTRYMIRMACASNVLNDFKANVTKSCCIDLTDELAY